MTYSIVARDSATGQRRARLISLVRLASLEALHEQCAPDAALCLDMRDGDLGDLGEQLVALFASLAPAQRAGLVATGHADRTILVAPAVPGAPSTRKLFLFSHPDAGPVSEIVAYTDDTPLDSYPGAQFPPPPRTTARMPVRTATSAAVRRALVTASSGGLGFVLGSALLRAGIPTAFHGARDVLELPAMPGGASAVYLPGDLTQPDAAERLADSAAEALGGPVTVLVNTFGPWDATPLASAEPERWRRELDAHAGVALRLARTLVPGMRELGWGRVINVSAGSALARDHGLYGFGKAALDVLTETLAFELAPAVTVNAVAPGQIEESAPDMAAIAPGAVPAMVERTPAGRLVTRDEIAGAVLALLSPAFDMLTGAVLPLDGGYRIRRN